MLDQWSTTQDLWEQSPLNDNRFCALDFFSDLFKWEELTDADLFIYLRCLQNFLIVFHRDQIYSVKSIVLVAEY